MKPTAARPTSLVPRRSSGFTLTELIVAVALVLVLLVGVAQVFTYTTDTISVGMALSDANRSQRAITPRLQEDFRNLTPANSPGLVIYCGSTVAYLDRAERDADATGTPTTPYRTDVMGFFTTGDFRRQTGNDGVTAGPTTADQAWIWYGHLQLPGVGATFPNPGQGTPETNPNNYYATQWRLGRVAILLKNSAAIPAGQFHLTDSGTLDMKPLLAGTTDNRPASPNPPAPQQLTQSRFDLAGVQSAGADVFPRLSEKIAANPVDWWLQLLGYRFEADPFPPRPLTSRGAAKTVPIFANNVTDFAVDFAVDLDTYDPVARTVTPGTPDGAADVRLIPNAADPNRSAALRWFGVPRADAPEVELYTGPGDRGNGFFAWRAADAANWPKLIRVTIKQRDAAARIEAKSVQYVLKVTP
ncbi:MAG TPA: prepilin-type N-terminal cleavage/methylation domain-containing protein [Tepidisphaeraceae bacterium]|nr:prepilin-type N-terminal cleavage/methylation domain-containing protein [Tepidisphaeraceae bacterium]